MFDKRYKAIDVARGTNITPSVISRYLSGTNQPSRDNLFAVANYLGVSSEWLLSSSEAPESSGSSKYISSDKDKIIAVQEELIKSLQKQVLAQSHYIQALFKELEEAKAGSKERHARGKAKADLATSKHKNTLRIKTTRKRKKW